MKLSDLNIAIEMIAAQLIEAISFEELYREYLLHLEKKIHCVVYDVNNIIMIHFEYVIRFISYAFLSISGISFAYFILPLLEK